MATDIDENFDVLDFNLNQKLTLYSMFCMYLFQSIRTLSGLGIEFIYL